MSDLVGNPKDRFSQNEAQNITINVSAKQAKHDFYIKTQYAYAI